MVTIKEPPSCTISNFGGRQGLCNVQDTKYLQKYFKGPFGTDTREKNKYQNHWGPVSLNPPSLLNDQSERPTKLQKNIWEITKSQIFRF